MANAANLTGPNSEDIKGSPQQIRAGSSGSLVIDVALPAGYHLNPNAPQRYSVTVDNAKVISLDEKIASRSSKDLKLPLSVPFSVLGEGAANVRAQATFFYCRDDNTGTCRIKTLVWTIPVAVTTDQAGATEVKVSGKLTLE